MKRFIDAHKEYFDIALKEIKNGKKESHWMWFIFPQIKGLGESEISKHYAINSIFEAKYFLENDYLKNNYYTLLRVLLRLDIFDPVQIFGEVDAMKFHSSVTLFKLAYGFRIFDKVLNKFFDGKIDLKTYEIYKKMEHEYMENKKSLSNKKMDDLNLTEDQKAFLVEHNLMDEIKHIVEVEHLINVDIDDFNLILSNREIIGYVDSDDFENFEIHKLNDSKSPNAIVYIEGNFTLFVVNEIIERIRNSFGNDINCIYSCGYGENVKVFALITG